MEKIRDQLLDFAVKEPASFFLLFVACFAGLYVIVAGIYYRRDE